MAEFPITQVDAGDTRAFNPSVAVTPDGNMVVAWRQSSTVTNINRDIGVRVLTAAGTVVSSEVFTTPTAATGSENQPEIIAIDNNNFVVAYSVFSTTSSRFEVHARTLTLSGGTLTVGSDHTISDTSKDGSGQVSLTKMDNGNIAFVWGESAADFSSSRAVVRITDSTLNPLSAITQVSQTTTNSVTNAEIIANGNNLAVAWTQNGGGGVPTYGYSFTANADGTIPALTLSDLTIRTGSTGLNDFIKLANGDLLVLTFGGPTIGGALDDGDRLYGTIYSANFGSVVKATFQINQSEQTTGVGGASAVALANGGFVIMYSQEVTSSPSLGFDVFYRTYNSSYNATGNATVLHDNGDLIFDTEPVGIISGANSDLTIVWTRRTSSGSDDALVGDRVLNLVPAPAGPVVAANTGSSLNEGALDVVLAAELTVTDADTAAASLVYTVTTAVTRGTLWLDTDSSGTVNGGESALGIGGTFTQANIASGLLKYRHNGGETTSDSFVFSVTDSTTTVTGQTFAFTINPVNDPAVLSSASVQLNATEERLTTGGALTISDVDNPATYVAQTEAAGTNGKFWISTSGVWAYVANESFVELATGSSVSDTFTIAAADGTTTTVQVTINGQAGNGTSPGRDVVSGNGSNNTLNGGNGSDILDGGAGADSLDGGGGNDTATYDSASAGVRVSLFDPAVYNTGDAAGDTYTSIENLLGSNFGDTLFGNSGNNLIDGGGGNDVLFGMEGDDVLIGGSVGSGGTNQLWGDIGSDTASYAATTTGVYADLVATGGWIRNGGGTLVLTDTYNSIENLVGGSGVDTLAGDANANRLEGFVGADHLHGRGGADTFVYRVYADSNLIVGYDTVADFVAGTDKLDLTAFSTDASHVAIVSGAASTSLYVLTTVGSFNASTDLAISFIGVNALTTSDILF